ncbi:hypothetical protein [Parapedobacter sp. DT-150]|uniref:hypothetical protein n=1 Tax=Parapedobacter sp. DT-150 TaxID=3396162 RepID=UPI003F1D27D1
MKDRYLFTNDGVQLWQSALYAQTDAELWKEAALVAAGLADWLPYRFELSTDQVTFLIGIDESLRQVWAVEIAYAIRHRIPIILNKPEQPEGISITNTKLVLSEGELDSSPGSTASSGGEGRHLTFIIVY